MKPYLKSEFVDEPGKLGTAEKVGTSSSGAVTAAAVASAISDMNATQTAQALSDLGGEPQKMTVTFTESGGVISADKTISEIKAAYDAGKTINGIYNTNNYQLRFVGVGIVEFYCVGYTSNSGGYEVYYLVSGLSVLDVDTWSFTSANISKNPTETTVSGTTPTITPAPNTAYNCGELTSLTISNPPATGAYSIVFTSGATPTTTTIPATILGLEDFAAEANTLYEINVLDNRAVVGSWAVSA